jgi:hypothetical protein
MDDGSNYKETPIDGIEVCVTCWWFDVFHLRCRKRLAHVLPRGSCDWWQSCQASALKRVALIK